ncbi:MAG: acylneuraminate cytidylyltransferase family protein, partial [Bdellovibrionales bacterium]|nr:acylneuraminate cytidylyltransferase family protein [Bdellovibrionales bacterium]
MKTWFVIPARGGSVGVPRKNLRNLAGRPLIRHVLDTACAVTSPGQVIVVTDDEEIAATGRDAGARIYLDPKTTGKATLDQVMVRTIAELESWSCGASDEDLLLTLQPTCPFLSRATIENAMAAFSSGETGSVLTVIDDRHLRWKMDASGRPTPAYLKRVNRQEMAPEYRESGGIIGARIGAIKARGTRIVEPITLIPVSRNEGLDIDGFDDWMVAEYLSSRKKIFIRTDGDTMMGMGHLY